MTNGAISPSKDDLPLSLTPAFTVTLKLARPVLAGTGGIGPSRAVIGIEGGTVEGPRLQGSVQPGGSEWARLGPASRIVFDSRYLIQTDDGTIILVENAGYRWSTPEVEAKLRTSEPVPADDYYMVASPTFDVAAGPHDWLTRTVLVGRGERLAEGNRIAFYAVENA